MKIFEDSFYLSNPENLDKAIELTGLSLDELEIIVGRFKNHSSRAGQLRGEVLLLSCGNVIIRHHFNKKILWESEMVDG